MTSNTSQHERPRSYFKVPPRNATLTHTGGWNQRKWSSLQKTWKLLEPLWRISGFLSVATWWYKGYHYRYQSWGYRARAEPRTPGLILQQSLLSLQVLCGLTADAKQEDKDCSVPLNSTPLVTSIQSTPKTMVCQIHCTFTYNVKKSKSREMLPCCIE